VHKRFLTILLSLAISLPVLAQTQPQPATIEQTFTCLNNSFTEADDPALYYSCWSVIAPAVCNVWSQLPAGFTATQYSRYMTLWNTVCSQIGTDKHSPPP